VRPAGTLAENAPLILYTRYMEMITFAAHIQDPARVQELHSMRIAAKRLRYTLEIFEPAYTKVYRSFLSLINEVKLIQEKIGEIHDCDVRIDQINDYFNQNIAAKPEIRTGLNNLIDREVQQRSALYAAFIKYWDRLASHNAFERKFVDIVFSPRLIVPPAKASNGVKGRR
jgi:CHAD domain-containing protein